MTKWLLDFEGFHFPNWGFVIKEIAILNMDDKDQCFNYFIKGPKCTSIGGTKSFNFQLKRHNLCWEFGDYDFVEAMIDIARKLRDGTVYMKGREKFNYLSPMFVSARFIELEGIPSFKCLHSCKDERCKVKHGNCCARRKVHELLHYVTNSESF
jgi:hypothetical protein